MPIDRGGGTETFISSFINLPAEVPDVRVDVVAPEPEGARISEPPNVHVRYFKADALVRLLFHFRNARNPIANVALLVVTALTLAYQALKATAKDRYDVIYAVGGPIAGLAGIFVKVVTRIPLVMHFHYTYGYSGSNRIAKFLTRTFFNRSNAAVGNCPLFAQDLESIGVDRAKCQWVLNWVDDSVFFVRSDRRVLREKYKLADHQTCFVFAGRLDWTKQADRVIDALRDFAVPDAVFLFAGSGELYADLSQVAAQNPNIRLLGTLAPAELAEVYNAADILLWGSRDIDYPSLVVMEAMSCGLPVVTSKYSFNYLYEGQAVDQDVLCAPKYSKHYEPTREGIQSAIRNAIDDRPQYAALRSEIAAFASAHFGRSNADRLIRILRGAAVPRT